MWRDAARELQTGEQAPVEEAVGSSTATPAAAIVSPAAADPEDEKSAWSSWNSAATDWEKTLEEAPARDAKQVCRLQPGLPLRQPAF